MKRILAFLCVLAMMLSLIPAAAFAAEQDLSVRQLEEHVKKVNRKKKVEPEVEVEDDVPFVDYFREMELKIQSHLGRVVKIKGKGRNKSITLFYEDNEDLDELLRSICGKDFLNDL